MEYVDLDLKPVDAAQAYWHAYEVARRVYEKYDHDTQWLFYRERLRSR